MRNQSNNNSKSKSKPKKKKIVVVFNEDKRKEYLTGFRKRKNDRKRKAQEELKVQLKEERSRIKKEVKEQYKTMTKSYQSIPELDAILEEKEYDTENATVKVVELSTSDLAERKNWIGANKPVYSDDELETKDDNLSELNDSEDEIPGMELNPTKKKCKPIVNDENSHLNEKVDKTKTLPSDKRPKSKKELNKILSKKAVDSMKNSKAFQLKRKMDKVKDKKKHRKEQNLQKRLVKEGKIKKREPKKKKGGKNRTRK